MSRWELYIHIPFCRQKCLYCDFASWAGRDDLMSAYVNAVKHDIETRAASLRRENGPAATIYIGGGTPTALPRDLLLTLVQSAIDTSGMPGEFTVEVNPGTADEETLRQLRQCGVNRLSFGVQSFNNRLLRVIGRIHTAEEAEKAIRTAEKSGFSNVSLDLMYGLPGQNLDDLKSSVNRALSLPVTHISIYGLQVEEGTPFYRMYEEGKLALPDDDVTEAMYDYMTEELPRRGFRRYEISNFARPGFESRHNLGYWQDVPYLGVGAAAHSYLDGKRTENRRDPADYIRAVEAGEPVCFSEEESSRDIAMEEFAFLALRTASGIDESRFTTKFGCSIDAVYGDVIAPLVRDGLLRRENGHIALTRYGAKYGNLIFEKFIRSV